MMYYDELDVRIKFLESYFNLQEYNSKSYNFLLTHFHTTV